MIGQPGRSPLTGPPRLFHLRSGGQEQKAMQISSLTSQHIGCRVRVTYKNDGPVVEGVLSRVEHAEASIGAHSLASDWPRFVRGDVHTSLTVGGFDLSGSDWTAEVEVLG